MTESFSDQSTVVPDTSSDQKTFVIQMLCIYREAALAQLVEAEDAIVRAIELREHALGLLDRAAALAYEYAKEQDAERVATDIRAEEDSIAW